MRDLMSLFEDEKNNCLKYFFHLNFMKYEEFDELIFFMSIIFSKSENAINKEIDKIRLRPYVYGRKSVKELVKTRQKIARKKREMLRFTEVYIRFGDENRDKEFYPLK